MLFVFLTYTSIQEHEVSRLYNGPQFINNFFLRCVSRHPYRVVLVFFFSKKLNIGILKTTFDMSIFKNLIQCFHKYKI